VKRASAVFARYSGKTARRRLKLLLVSDKAGCSPELLLMLKDDVLHVISKYMEIEEDSIQIQMENQHWQEGEKQTLPVLRANIPIRSIYSKGLY
jgi:cell division topological specificity factor